MSHPQLIEETEADSKRLTMLVGGLGLAVGVLATVLVITNASDSETDTPERAPDVESTAMTAPAAAAPTLATAQQVAPTTSTSPTTTAKPSATAAAPTSTAARPRQINPPAPRAAPRPVPKAKPQPAPPPSPPPAPTLKVPTYD